MEGAAGRSARDGARPDLRQRRPQPDGDGVHAARAQGEQPGRHARLGCKWKVSRLSLSISLPLSNSRFSRRDWLTSRLIDREWQGFGGEDDGVLCGVFDGHGPHGHVVARRVRDSLPLRLMSAARDSGADMPAAAWRKAFARAYKAMDKDLRSHPSLDCFCSGSTAVTVLKLVRAVDTGHDTHLLSITPPSSQKCQIESAYYASTHGGSRGDFCLQGSDLYMANIGDSRAVLGSREATGGGMVAVQLTVDLKPDVPSMPLPCFHSPANRVRRSCSCAYGAGCDFRRSGEDQEVQGQGVRAAGRAGGAKGLAAVRRRAGPRDGASVRGLLPERLRGLRVAGFLPLGSHRKGPVRHSCIGWGNLLEPIT